MTDNLNKFAADGHTDWIPETGVARAYVFHEKMGLTIGEDWTKTPSVSERLLRGRLLLEEVVETFTAMGLAIEMFKLPGGDLEPGLVHIEGSRYDPVETADGLADVKVIANGTAIAFGIPMRCVDMEVFCSNMSKLDADGNPVVNQCNSAGCPDEGSRYCEIPEHQTDPTKPAGKLLKSSRYIPANIQGLYDHYTIGER